MVNATLVEDTWSRFVHVDSHNEFKLIGEPLLKGYAFLLAAFGLAEIAYVSTDSRDLPPPQESLPDAL